MQRTENDGIIISCDFCGSDWDPVDTSMSAPMVEGHHGSVICLACLIQALDQMAPSDQAFDCTLCLVEAQGSEVQRWRHPGPTPSPGLAPKAVACRACIRQAAGRFGKDPEVQFTWP